VAITLLAGSATALAGPIGFVGLMVPHVVRWLVGPDQRRILPLSALGGAILLVTSDVLSRIMLGQEIPVGVVTAFVGAPVLVALVRRRKVSGL
jgi:iron complex transport system permease protein